jgi:ATP-dependent Clp protease, protease subunit
MSSYTIPNVIAQHPRGERIMDVYSHLLTERIVYLGTAIDPGVANTLIAQLLHLEAESPEQEINLYINCEGGDLPSMLAVYDTMQYIQASVATTCVGQAIGVGAVLLAAGTAGRRALLPHARVVLHQPAARGQGPIPDLILQADEVVRMRAEIEAILSAHTGQSVQTLRTDTDRDRVLTAQAARDYGIVDQVLGQRSADEGAPGSEVALGGAGEHHRAGRTRRGDIPLATQIAGHLLGQPDERGPQRSREGRDHLARRLLAPALNLGKVLRRYPGPARGLGDGFLPVRAEGAQALAEHLPPQRLPRLSRWFRRGLPPQRIDTRTLGHNSAYERTAASEPPFRCRHSPIPEAERPVAGSSCEMCPDLIPAVRQGVASPGMTSSACCRAPRRTRSSASTRPRRACCGRR